MTLALDDQGALAQLEAIVGSVDQIEAPLNHYFSGGVYIRELTIPKGAVIVGKRHRHETCNILLKGEMLLFSGIGKDPVRIKGPMIFTSAPYTKKAGLAIEETIFLNIHPTSETDLEKIEDFFIIPEAEFLALISRKAEVIE